MTKEEKMDDNQNGVSVKSGELHFTRSLAEDPTLFLDALGQLDADLNLSSDAVMEARQFVSGVSNLAAVAEADQWWSAWQAVASSTKPSVALNTLDETGWLMLFPNLSDLQGVPQSAQWHPEGDVWNHTLEAMDAAATNARREGLSGDELVLATLATMCHDFGKVTHTQVHDDGRITSHEHDVAGVRPAKAFLRSVGAPELMVNQVGVLVRTHMRHIVKNPSLKAVGKLVATLEQSGATFEQWCRVADGDTGGRGEASETDATAVWRARHAEWVEAKNAPDPGRVKSKPSQEQIDQWRREAAERKAARTR